MKKLYSLVFALILLYAFAQEAEAQGVRTGTKVTFEYVMNEERTSAIPIVSVYTYDYKTGRYEEERIPQPQYAIEVDKDTKLDDNQATRNLVTGGKQEGVIVSLKRGVAVVFVDRRQLLISGKTSGAIETRLMEFNLSTRKLTVLNRFVSDQEDAVTLYPEFKGYSYTPSEKINDESSSRKTIAVYSLETNREVAKSARLPWPGSQENVLQFGYDRTPAYDSLIIQESVSNKTKAYELFADGRKVELGKLKSEEGITWVKQVGKMKYAQYKDPISKTVKVGYYKGNKLVPLSLGTGYPKVSFSPGNKYMIIAEGELDPKTKKPVKKFATTVVDAATAKVLYKLPPFEKYEVENIYEWVTDEFVKIQFLNSNRAQPRYLHIPSRLTTLASGMPGPNGNYSKRKYVYQGAAGELLNPETPYGMYIDGKPVTYSGQGPFRLTNSEVESEWYVPLQEFAAVAGATVVDRTNLWEISRGTHSVQLEKKDVITFGGEVYAPLAELTENLGFAAAFTTTSSRNHSIYIFTPDLTEDEVKSRFDDQRLEPGYHDRMFTLTNGKWNIVLEEVERKAYNTYLIGGANVPFSLSFADGRLAAVYVADGNLIRNEGVDRGYVLKDEMNRLYGKGEAVTFDLQLPDYIAEEERIKFGRLQALSYKFPDYGLLAGFSWYSTQTSMFLYFAPNNR